MNNKAGKKLKVKSQNVHSFCLLPFYFDLSNNLSKSYSFAPVQLVHALVIGFHSIEHFGL
jgi:hypothetical protein